MRVRPVRRDDLGAICRIAAAGLWEEWQDLLRGDTLGRLLASECSGATMGRRLLRGGMLVAEDTGGAIAGYVDAVSGPAVVAVTALAVDPARRRQGLGRLLVGAVVDQSLPEAIYTDVMLGCLQAEGFLEHLGFVPGEVIPRSRFDEVVVERRWWLAPG
jgi:GNAT superfamily N-acetyltransferase